MTTSFVPTPPFVPPPPSPAHVFLPPDCFIGWLLPDAIDPARCAALLADVCARGFARTGAHYPADYRDNDRLVFDDPGLAASLYTTLRARLPATIVDDGAHWELCGLNPRFRACQYTNGQAFCIHRDGPFAPTDTHRSFLTVQLYLDDDPARIGGHTRFYADPRGDVRWASIAPAAGAAIVFDHRAWHDGEAVTAGIKHVLRTDAMYRRVSSAHVGTNATTYNNRGRAPVSAHVGATAESAHVGTRSKDRGDVSAETRRGDIVMGAPMTATAESAHVGTRSKDRGDVSAETRRGDIVMGAPMTATAESAHVGTRSKDRGDVSAETRRGDIVTGAPMTATAASAHVGGTATTAHDGTATTAHDGTATTAHDGTATTARGGTATTAHDGTATIARGGTSHVGDAATTSHVGGEIVGRHRGYAWQAIACRDGSIASAGRDGTLRRWALGDRSRDVITANRNADDSNASDSTARVVDLGLGSITAIAEDERGRIWCGSRSGEVVLVDAIGERRRRQVVARNLGAITSIASSNDLVDTNGEPPLDRRFQDRHVARGLGAIAGIADGGELVAVSTSLGTIVAFDAAGAIRWTTSAHDGWAWGIAAYRDGFVSCGHDGRVVAIDRDGRAHVIAELGAPVRAIAAIAAPERGAPRGVSEHGAPERGAPVRAIAAIAAPERGAPRGVSEHGAPERSAAHSTKHGAFSPVLFAGDSNGWLHTLTSSGRILGSRRAHAATITSIALAGEDVISASEDGTVKRWRGIVGEVLLASADFVTSVAIDRRGVIVAGYDGSIRLLRAERRREDS